MVAGMVISLGATSPQTLNGTSYTFSNWQNNVGTSGTITVPEANTTYRGNFIVNNLGFENNFTSWITYGTASIKTDNFKSDANSGYFAGVGESSGGNYKIGGLTPGATYKVKAWVKAVNGQDIWVVVNNYGGAQTGARMTSTSWTQSGDIVFTMGASNTEVTLAAWTGSGSSAYFDDFTIETCSSCRISAEAGNIPQTEVLPLLMLPNPASREVSISLAGFEGETAVQVRISDMNGKSFLHEQVQTSVEGKRVSLSVGHLPQGLFFVSVLGSKIGKTAKLIITK
jgi:hypothetical protein